MMKDVPYIMLALIFTAGVAGCGGGASVKEEAPVEEQSVGMTGGAETGAFGGTDTQGATLGEGGTQLAMAAERPDTMRVHFEFDSSAVDSTSRAIIEAHAAYLAANPDVTISLEGHADERGTREYNLALGERRGQAVQRVLSVLGISANRLTTTSYGEENPLAVGHNESAWRLNRRVEFIY